MENPIVSARAKREYVQAIYPVQSSGAGSWCVAPAVSLWARIKFEYCVKSWETSSMPGQSQNL